MGNLSQSSSVKLSKSGRPSSRFGTQSGIGGFSLYGIIQIAGQEPVPPGNFALMSKYPYCQLAFPLVLILAEVYSRMTWWRATYMGLEVGSGVLAAACAVMYVLSSAKKKEEKVS